MTSQHVLGLCIHQDSCMFLISFNLILTHNNDTKEIIKVELINKAKKLKQIFVPIEEIIKKEKELNKKLKLIKYLRKLLNKRKSERASEGEPMTQIPG